MDAAGMMQLALYDWSQQSVSAPVRFLTQGNFEVSTGVQGYRPDGELLFYVRSAANGIERAVESVARNGTVTRWGKLGGMVNVQISKVFFYFRVHWYAFIEYKSFVIK
jgi:hypothetical protein